MTTNFPFEPLSGFPEYNEEESLDKAKAFFNLMKKRRTVRDFTEEPVARAVIDQAIATAGRAPSGANKQPWHFAVIESAEVKAKLRVAAEEEERAFYNGRASEEWLADLAPLGTDAEKPFLEKAPYLIVVFRQNYMIDATTGEKHNNYYVHESVGIACGFLLASLHQAGLATLTHTPAPMNFLNEICGRPKNERAVMIVVAGKPEKECLLPVIAKKNLDEIRSWI